MRHAKLLAAFFLVMAVTAGSSLRADEPEVGLDRGLVARRVADGVYLSWRLLPSDPAGAGFTLERRVDAGKDATALTTQPLQETTDFLDRQAPEGALTYRLVLAGAPAVQPVQVAVSGPAVRPEEPYQVIKLEDAQTVQKVGIADLDGDGALDYVVKQPNSNVDPYEFYWKRSPGTIKLAGYRSDGTHLWTHDLGWSIEQGIWYSPYLVTDLDGDGKAELALKAGEGDPRDPDGRVQTGPEWLEVRDGLTAQPITRLAWPDRKPFYDANAELKRGYNYASRNQLAVARLDGKNPYLIALRGTYNLMIVRAYRMRDRQLELVWEWSNVGLGKEYQGQGAHWTQAADVDGDGREELILGSLVLDDDGTPLWTTGMGHPDHLYIGDIDPERKGLEIYYGMETRQKANGMCLADAATGKILWGHADPTRHVHGQGLCSDLTADYPGSESYSADTDANKDYAYSRLRTAEGQVISEENLGGFAPRTVYWDADAQRELIRKGLIADLDGEPLRAPKIPGELVAVADILGDWREELVSTVPGELRIYATTIPARDRRVTLMSDPIYWSNVTHASMGYYQVPMLSYDMASTPAP